MKKLLAGISTAIVGVMALGGSAFATTPTPPDETAFASDILGTFGNKLFDVVTALATNPWVLAIFGMGIAVAIVKRVLNRGTSKVSKVVG